MSRSIRSSIVLTLLLNAAACVTWQRSQLQPRQLFEEQGPQTVRLWSNEGNSVVVARPRLERDSVAIVTGTCVGFGQRPRRRYRCPTTSIMALDDIHHMEIKRMARGRTLALLSPFLALGVFALAWASGGGF